MDGFAFKLPFEGAPHFALESARGNGYRFSAMVSPVSKTVELRGLPFHYFDHGGEGLPPAILLHGTGLNAALWHPYAAAMAGRFHVYALDQRGHGDSTKDAGDYRWQLFAEDFLAFIDALKIERPFCVGHSMGGAVIVLAEGRRPGTVARAVLIDPIIIGPAHYDDRWKIVTDDPMAARTLRRRAVWDSREAMMASYRARPPFDTWQEEQLRLYVEHGTEPAPEGKVRLKCTPEIEAHCYFGGHLSDPWPAVRVFRAPMMLIRGTGGDTFRVTRAEEIVAAIPGAVLVDIPGATHFLPMEQPDVVIRHILDFADAAVETNAARD